MKTPVRAFDALIGTGGLGNGIMLALEGNHTIGREESRSVQLLAQKDRCKLQNIVHYVARLTDLRVIPLGRVGNDDAGRMVAAELAREGMDVTKVVLEPDLPTLTSYCFLYPNGDGGNLTTSRSASSAVSVEDMARSRDDFARYGARALALAAPEVPLAARRALLELAGRFGALRFASFLTGEVREAFEDGLLSLVDILSINIDEASVVAGLDDATSPTSEDIATAAAAKLTTRFPNLRFCITAGADGSWIYDGRELAHISGLTVKAVNTAGAGDAHLGGLITATAWGFDLVEANRIATMLSAQSVLSLDTINEDITVESFRRFAEHAGVALPAGFIEKPTEASDKTEVPA
jgi:ribokinase